MHGRPSPKLRWFVGRGRSSNSGRQCNESARVYTRSCSLMPPPSPCHAVLFTKSTSAHNPTLGDNKTFAYLVQRHVQLVFLAGLAKDQDLFPVLLVAAEVNDLNGPAHCRSEGGSESCSFGQGRGWETFCREQEALVRSISTR